MTRQLDADIPTRVTADGVAVKRGDVIYTTHCYGTVRRKTVTRDTLKVWAYWHLEQSAYADERKAVLRALNEARTRLVKAKQNVVTETKAIKRLSARLTTTPRLGDGDGEGGV